MWEIDFPFRGKLVAIAEPERRRRPFADPVEAKHGRTLEGARKESGSGVRLVVLGKQQWRKIRKCAPASLGKFMAQDRLQIELLLEPKWHRGEERAQSLWREPEVGLEHALELDPGFVVEDDVIDIGEANSRLRQTIRDGMGGKTRIMLAAGKALLLSRGDDFAAVEQRSRAVVIIGGNSKNLH